MAVRIKCISWWKTPTFPATKERNVYDYYHTYRTVLLRCFLLPCFLWWQITLLYPYSLLYPLLLSCTFSNKANKLSYYYAGLLLLICACVSAYDIFPFPHVFHFPFVYFPCRLSRKTFCINMAFPLFQTFKPCVRALCALWFNIIVARMQGGSTGIV